MRRQRNLVLMAEQAQVTHPDLAGAQPTMPAELFLSAAKTNWGVAWLDPDLDFDCAATLAVPVARPVSEPAVDGRATGGREVE